MAWMDLLSVFKSRQALRGSSGGWLSTIEGKVLEQQASKLLESIKQGGYDLRLHYSEIMQL